MRSIAGQARAIAPFLAVATVCVGAFAASGWRATGTDWPVPIDDAYIYAQYARNFAQGHPFEWYPGGGYSRGCTSPLYPLLLAPMWLVGLRDHWLMMGAAILNTLGLAAGLMAVHRLVSGISGGNTAASAVAVLATTGIVAWNAASGMEAGLAFGACGAVALHFARAWRGDATTREFTALCIAQSLLMLLRPESLVPCAILSASLVPRAGAVTLVRRVAILGMAPLPIAGYFALNAAMTDGPMTASMLTKSIWGDPSLPAPLLVFLDRMGDWTQSFRPGVVFPGLRPDSSSHLLGAVLVVVLLLARRPSEAVGAMYLLLLASAALSLFLLGQRVPSGGPHLRYVMPYLPMVVGALAVLTGLACEGASAWILRNFPAAPRRTVWAVWGVPAALLVMAVPWQLSEFAEQRRAFAAEARVLQAQQVAIGRHIAAANRREPGTYRRVYTHDAGAVMYFSGIRGFDAHGLCMETPGYPIHRAQYEGTFFPFEAIEHCVPDEDLPDVTAMFSAGWGQWPNAAEPILVPDVPLEGRAFLVGTDMKLFRFPREAVRSGHTLNEDESGGWVIHDRLDVADLVSERDHGFAMDWPAERPFRAEYLLVDRNRTPPLADAGRRILSRTTFRMRVPAGPSRIVARLEGLRPGTTLYSVDDFTGEGIESRGNEGPVLVHLADCMSERARSCRIELRPQGGALLGLAHVYVLRPPGSPSEAIPQRE